MRKGDKRCGRKPEFMHLSSSIHTLVLLLVVGIAVRVWLLCIF